MLTTAGLLACLCTLLGSHEKRGRFLVCSLHVSTVRVLFYILWGRARLRSCPSLLNISAGILCVWIRPQLNHKTEAVRAVGMLWWTAEGLLSKASQVVFGSLSRAFLPWVVISASCSVPTVLSPLFFFPLAKYKGLPCQCQFMEQVPTRPYQALQALVESSRLVSENHRRSRCIMSRNSYTFVLQGELIIWTIYLGLCWIHCHVKSFKSKLDAFPKNKISSEVMCLVKDFLGKIPSCTSWKKLWPFQALLMLKFLQSNARKVGR